MEGSRHFRAPDGWGTTLYEGARIIVFQDDLGQAGETWMRALKKRAAKTEMIAGFQVPIYQEKVGRDLWSCHYAQPRPNILIAATDRGYLQTILERMGRRGNRRALPAHLREWKQLDGQARCWAIHHHDRQDAEQDDSSPLGGPKVAAVPDEEAVGFAFFLDRSSGSGSSTGRQSDGMKRIQLLSDRGPSAALPSRHHVGHQSFSASGPTRATRYRPDESQCT